MLICESNLSRAIKTFLDEVKIPRPDYVSQLLDCAFVRMSVFPAFLKALAEIGEVNLCTGFSIEQAAAMFGQEGGEGEQ